MDARTFGAFLAQVRRERGMTQSQLAEKLRVTDKAVSRWERGLGFPDVNTMEPLADALGLSLSELLHSRREAQGEERFDQAETAALLQGAERTRREVLAHRLFQVVEGLSLLFLVISSLLRRMGMGVPLWLTVGLGGTVILLLVLRRRLCRETGPL